MNQINELIKGYKIVFWDFDGVIKDSVEEKTKAFMSLFLPFGQKVVDKVKEHHIKNSGVSRFDKFPIYLKWAGLEVSDELVNMYSNQLSCMVIDRVLQSPWVGGVKEYLVENYNDQCFVLISATPEDEIRFILRELSIDYCFCGIYGSPTTKDEIISRYLDNFNYFKSDALMIGDGLADFNASKSNDISFLLRITEINRDLQICYDGPQFRNL